MAPTPKTDIAPQPGHAVAGTGLTKEQMAAREAELQAARAAAEKAPKRVAMSEDEEVEALEAEVEKLEKRAKLVSLREKAEKLRLALAKGAEETFVSSTTGRRIPVKFKGALKYRVTRSVYRPHGNMLSAGDVVELIDEVPSRAMVPYVEKKGGVEVLSLSTPKQGRAADTAV